MKEVISITDLIKKKRFLERGLNHIVFISLKLIRYFSKLFSKKNENIVIIALHKLGDSVFTFSAVNEIKKKIKENIFIICFPDSKPIYELIHPPHLIIEIPKNYFFFNERLAGHKARKILKNIRPRSIIDLTGVMTSASLIFNSSAEEIIGMNREIFKGIFTLFSPMKITAHSTDIYINAIKNFIPNDDYLIHDTKIDYDKMGLILIHPFAGWKSKEWNLNKFIDIGLLIAREYTCALVCQPNSIKDDIKKVIKDSNLNIIETQNVQELISCIKMCSLIIGNDSGAIQVAAFLGKPTFTIYGPTNPKFHLPLYNEKFNRFTQFKINCTPNENDRLCFTNGGLNGCPSFECLNLLSFDKVYDEVVNFISELGIEKKQFIYDS